MTSTAYYDFGDMHLYVRADIQIFGLHMMEKSDRRKKRLKRDPAATQQYWPGRDTPRSIGAGLDIDGIYTSIAAGRLPQVVLK